MSVFVDGLSYGVQRRTRARLLVHRWAVNRRWVAAGVVVDGEKG